MWKSLSFSKHCISALDRNMPVSTGLKYNHEVHRQNKNVLEIRLANIWWKVYSLHGWLQKWWSSCLARHNYPSLVLVQPRNTSPCLTEQLLMGRKESNKQILYYFFNRFSFLWFISYLILTVIWRGLHGLAGAVYLIHFLPNMPPL